VPGSYLPPVLTLPLTSVPPDNHFTAAPDCRVKLSASRCAGSVRCCPTIRQGIVFPSGVPQAATVVSTPDDHINASPHCCVRASGLRRVGGAGGHPAVAAGIISPSRIQVAAVINTTPDDHFTARPHRGVRTSCRRCVDEVGRRPGISRRIVSSTGIQKEILSTIATPNDHLTPGPDRRVVYSCVGRIGGTCSSPRVKACAFRIQCGRYRRKSITREWSNCFPRTSSLALGPADITVSQGRRKQALRKR